MSSPIHCLTRAVIIVQNHLLVSYNPQATQSYVYLPGGHIEEGESAQDALERELKEETGLSFQVGNFLGVLEYSFIPNNPLTTCHSHEYNFCFLAYSAYLENLELPPELEAESVRFKWIHLSKLRAANLLPTPLVELLPLWLQTNGPPFVFCSKMVDL